MKTKILVALGALLCVAAVDVVQRQIGLPEAAVTVRVVDEASNPLSGVNVSLGFQDRMHAQQYIFVRGQTDENGLFSGQGHSNGSIGAELKKDGYYDGWPTMPSFRDLSEGRWQPWNATFPAILRPIGHPVAMFVRKLSAVRIPGEIDDLRWSPETGQVGSLTQSQHNDPYVKETTSAQSRSESPGRLGSPEGH